MYASQVGLIIAVTIAANASSGMTPATLLVPYETGVFGVDVFTLEGREVARLGPRKPWKQGPRAGYYSPAIDPTNHRLAVVKCMVDAARLTYSEAPVTDCQIIVLEIASLVERVIVSQGTEGSFASLIWVDDGRRLAAFEGTSLVGIDVTSGTRTFVVENVLDYRAHPFPRGEPRLLRLSDTELGLVASRWEGCGPLDRTWFGRFNPDNGQLVWDCSEERSGGKSTCRDQASYALFNPPCPLYCWVTGTTSDGRYRTYVQRREGVFSKTWLKAQDRLTGESRVITVLDRALYAE